MKPGTEEARNMAEGMVQEEEGAKRRDQRVEGEGVVRGAGELFNIRYGTRAVTGMPHRCIILAIKASIMAGYLLIEYT